MAGSVCRRTRGAPTPHTRGHPNLKHSDASRGHADSTEGYGSVGVVGPWTGRGSVETNSFDGAGRQSPRRPDAGDGSEGPFEFVAEE